MNYPTIPDTETIPLTHLSKVERLRIALRARMAERELIHLIYEPGNGGRYEIVLTPLDDLQPVTSEAEFRGQDLHGKYLLSLVLHRRCMILIDGGNPQPPYVAEKLGMPAADCVALSYLFCPAPGAG